jgi:putative colanic acid biosynthesis acetyltransferase WcaF
MPDALDVAANRGARKWTRGAQARRLLWALAHPLFAWSPRIFWGWRRFLLRCFGADVGHDVHVFPSVRILIPWNLSIGDEVAIGDGAILYALAPIRIGRQATISQYAHLCAGTHDFTRADMALEKRPITIGRGAWICADAFIGPGVDIGELAIVGARGVVVKNVPANVIVAGNPARVLRERPPMQGPATADPPVSRSAEL